MDFLKPPHKTGVLCMLKKIVYKGYEIHENRLVYDDEGSEMKLYHTDLFPQRWFYFIKDVKKAIDDLLKGKKHRTHRHIELPEETA